VPVPVTLRPVEPGDDDLLLGLFASTRADEMTLTGWDQAQIDAFLRMQWEAQRADYTSRHPDADHHVVLAEGAAVGRFWVDRGADEIRVLDIVLVDTHRGRGIGTALLRGLQDEASRRGVGLGHAVVKENAGAIRFYERLGFTVLPDEHPTHLFMRWRAAAG
jgi:GNAT superfamily N-acetyltransferase